MPTQRLSYGPVPSRRLGRSLGINNVPAKTCSYSCIYCQVGRTTRMDCHRRVFYDPARLVSDVEQRVAEARSGLESIDYLAFVPDGEPTLDVNLGQEITRLQPLGIPVGVITNGSLLWEEDVRDELGRADWVSVKVDAAAEAVWRSIDRPHKSLEFGQVLNGIRRFAEEFEGELVTETMLVAGVNDHDESVEATAEFVGELRPRRSYLSVPTRPPAEKTVQGGPDAATLTRIYHRFQERVPEVEYLVGYEGDAFASTGDPVVDLLSITAVHPMRREAVSDLLARAGVSWQVVDDLVVAGELAVAQYGGNTFYLRRASGAGNAGA